MVVVVEKTQEHLPWQRIDCCCQVIPFDVDDVKVVVDEDEGEVGDIVHGQPLVRA